MSTTLNPNLQIHFYFTRSPDTQVHTLSSIEIAEPVMRIRAQELPCKASKDGWYRVTELSRLSVLCLAVPCFWVLV